MHSTLHTTMHSSLTPGLLGDAELRYRRERLAADLATSRRFLAWVGQLRRRGATSGDELVLAA